MADDVCAEFVGGKDGRNESRNRTEKKPWQPWPLIITGAGTSIISQWVISMGYYIVYMG